MKDYSQIVARVAEENPDFEEFFADMVARLPALKGRRGTLEMPTAGFKRALKTAYLAGDHDAMMRLINSDSSTPHDEKPSSSR